MKINDDILIRGLIHDDYISYNELFKRYYAPLCSFVISIIDNTETSEDIVQELFIKLWTKRKKLRIQTGNVRGYLFGASKNAALNYLRGEKNRRRLLEEMPANSSAVDHCFLEEEEFRLKLERCIDDLPERCKKVFLLSRNNNCKQREISVRMNISIKTVKNQIWKALTFLKSCLEINYNF